LQTDFKTIDMNENFLIINTDYINEVSSNSNFKKKIFSLFRKNVSEFENEMNNAIKKKDYNALAEIAHKAKSSVSILGMKTQATEMKHFELDLREEKNIDSYKERVSEFIQICYKAIDEIDKLEKML